MGARNADYLPTTPGQPTESSRERERRILRALEERPGEPEDVIKRAGLSQAAGTAMLSTMADSGAIRTIVVYALPGHDIEVR